MKQLIVGIATASVVLCLLIFIGYGCAGCMQEMKACEPACAPYPVDHIANGMCACNTRYKRVPIPNH